MENPRQEQHQKQWWAPVWKGLVMDAEAKHHHKMKNAVWLYLYLLLNANRTSGVLMRKTKTISADMGVSRDAVIRWLNILRQEEYIATVSTGRYLTIQVKNWRPIAKHARIQPQMLEISGTRSRINATPHFSDPLPFPDYFGRKSDASAFPKKTEINKLLNNETKTMQNETENGNDGAFKPIGSCARRELLAWDLARALDDSAGIDRYRNYCWRYPEELLKKALREVDKVPGTRTPKGRITLFSNLLQHYAQATS